jgi:GGDEF domain-containing protein
LARNFFLIYAGPCAVERELLWFACGKAAEDMVLKATATEMTNNIFEIESLLNQGEIELKRAERYRVFVSLILLDLSFVKEKVGDRSFQIMQSIVETAKEHIRASDIIARTNGSIALLFPETPRQGAEVSSRRLSDIIRRKISEVLNENIDEVIPLEIASYPDTAGARALSEFLEELQRKHRN